MWPTMNDGHEMIQRYRLTADALAADMAAPSVTFIDGLKVDRFNRAAAQQRSSLMAVLAVVFRVLLRMTCKPITLSCTSLGAMGRVIGAFVGSTFPQVGQSPLRSRRTGLLRIGLVGRSVSGAAQLRIGSPPFAGVFPTTCAALFAAAKPFGVSAITFSALLVDVVSVCFVIGLIFGPSLYRVTGTRIPHLLTAPSSKLVGIGPIKITVLLAVLVGVSGTVVTALLHDLIVVRRSIAGLCRSIPFAPPIEVFRHSNAAFPGTAGSYPTAPVRAA